MTPHTDNRYHQIKRAFEEHHQRVVKDFSEKHKHVIKKVTDKGVSLAGAAIVAGALLATSPSEIKKVEATQKHETLAPTEMIKKVKGIIGDKEVLTEKQELEVQDALSEQLGMNLKVTLDGNRLNEIYGYTGAEQHLYRWAGDSLSQHANLQKAGIAPLKGAFGYFDNAEQEEYYVAVQLHELPTWNQDWPKLKPWYRFRKVLVYNPDNNKAVVAVIGDSGPSKWTSKTFGCSPEIMQHLERVDGARKGHVVILFIDDKDNKIALGPVEMQGSNLALK